MDLANLLERVRATRSRDEPLHATAAAVWFALTDQLDTVDHEALGAIGLETLRTVGAAPATFQLVISASALAAALAGTADWRYLRPADQEAFALLGFLTLVAEIAVVEDQAPARLN